MAKDKVGKVMHEFRTGALHSGSKKGPVVKNRKQAIAIAMSEAGMKKKYATGGMMEDGDVAQDKAMISKAIKQHDAHMHGGKKESIKLKGGGSVSSRADGCVSKGHTKGKMY